MNTDKHRYKNEHGFHRLAGFRKKKGKYLYEGSEKLEPLTALNFTAKYAKKAKCAEIKNLYFIFFLGVLGFLGAFGV